MIVEVSSIQVSDNYNFKTRKFLRRKFQTVGGYLLRGEVILCRKRLHEMIKLPPVRLAETLFGSHHLGESALRNAVMPGYKFQIFSLCIMMLRHIFQALPASRPPFAFDNSMVASVQNMDTHSATSSHEKTDSLVRER